VSSPWRTVPYRTADDAHERMIELVKLRFLAAKTTDERRELFDTMRELIRTRSPEQVARIERERGLR
jgi:hypothetical protein